MFGRVKPHDTMNGVMEVTTPLKAITYDVVTNPSHSSARVMSFLTESNNYDSFIQESDEYVTESLDELMLENEICLPGTCKDECQSHLRSLFVESFNNVRNLRFNI